MEQIEIFEFEEMKNDPSGISIKRYIGTGSRRVAVPEEQDGKPVKQIAAKAFVQKDSQITELFLPECMENIMVGAFKGMQQLQGVNLPEGIVKISAACFED